MIFFMEEALSSPLCYCPVGGKVCGFLIDEKCCLFASAKITMLSLPIAHQMRHCPRGDYA